MIIGTLRPEQEHRPATLDLRDPLRRAVDCVINRMGQVLNYQPWFAIDIVNGRPTRLRHDMWDFSDTSGRFLEALILAKQMIHSDPEMLQAEERIRRFLNSLFDADGHTCETDDSTAGNFIRQKLKLYGLRMMPMALDFDHG